MLTANIGTLLDLYGIERGLEHFRSTPTLNFDQYKYYLQKEVFSSLPDKLPLSELREYENRIAEVCWLVCRRHFLGREKKVFGDDSVFQIFRIFCVLAELAPDTEESYQVLLHPAEASRVAQTLATSLGCPWDEEDFANLSACMGSFRLAPFVAVLESRCLDSVKDPEAIAEAVAELYQTIVEDVIKKGFLSKRGYIFPAMREYWFVLRPSELSYYKTRSEKNLCGSIAIEAGSRVEPKADFRIALHTPERNFELATSDHMTKLQWMSALQQAVDHCGGHQTYQRLQAARRRLQRQGRFQEALRAKAQLQFERTARQAAEGQARELEAAVREEAKKLNELEQIKERLERLLVEETQAKRDEEIVRALQARVLAEEWEKREELEKLQEEQRVLLEEERGKLKEYQHLQKEKERQLQGNSGRIAFRFSGFWVAEAERRLEQLEGERKALDEQLKTAHDKIILSENKREILEARLTQVAPILREGDRIRRAHSFIPSTKERPVMVEVRASTLRRSKN